MTLKSKLISKLIAGSLLLSALAFSSNRPTDTRAFDPDELAALLAAARDDTASISMGSGAGIEEAIDFERWSSLVRQEGAGSRVDPSNLRLVAQLVASQSFSATSASPNQILFQALNFEFFRMPDKTKGILKNLNPNSLTQQQSLLWHQLYLRALIEGNNREAAHQYFNRMLRERPALFLNWASFQDAVNLLQDLGGRAQLQFYVDILDRHPNRKILKASYEQMMRADFSQFRFDYLFLRRLALGRDMVDGMQEWLAQVFVDGNIGRYRHHPENYLRLLLLIRIEEFSRAETIARKLIRGSQSNQQQYLDYNRRLGQILERLNRSGEAFNLYSDLLDRFGRNRQTRAIWESYARLLGQTSSFSDSAREYGQLSRIDNRRHIRWYHFWFLYRAGRYQDALALIENNRRAQDYSRDDREPFGIYYWKARIYENLGRQTEALEQYRRILQRDGGSFYTTLIIGQQPAKELSSRQLLRSELAKSGVAFANDQSLSRHELIDFPGLSYYEWREARRARRTARLGINDISQLVSNQMTNRDHWMLAYPLIDHEWLVKVGQFFNVDPLILASIIRAESFYNPNAVSPVGAQGLMQIMPYTALKISSELADSSFNFDDLKNPKISMVYGAYYIRKLLDYFDNNIILALASYNAGPFRTIEWVQACGMCEADEFVESVTFLETRRYIKSILSHYAHYKRIYRHEASPSLANGIPDEFALEAVIY